MCALIIAAVCVILLIICMSSGKSKKETPVILENSYSREAYLNINGWDAEEISCETVRVPEVFEGIYEEYAKIQDKQKLPLRSFKGKEVLRYLYNINNYNGNCKAFGELLICDDELVSAAIIEKAPDGKILPL